MVYNIYPAVDAGYNFPPEVRTSLAKSLELRNTVLPMTQTARNNLSGAELWDGRVILNMTTGRLNRYVAASTTWLPVADYTDTPVPMSTAARDALSGTDLWDGRLIVNTSTDRINRYDLGTASWIPVADVSDVDALLATSGTPSPAGVAARGTASKAARSDHVHDGPRGILKWSRTAATQGPYQVGGYIPGMDLTINRVAGRLYKVVFDGNMYMSPGNANADLRIYRDTTHIGTGRFYFQNGWSNYMHIEHLDAATVNDTVTYKVWLQSDAGSNVHLIGATWQPITYSVEDVGLTPA